MVVALVVAVAFFPVLFLGRTPVLRDALRFSLPSREYLGRSLAAGRIPEWWDGVAFGVPFAADPVHGVTYPLTAILALAPSALGLDLFTLVHLLIAGLGTAALARRLGASPAGSALAGGVLMTSGFVTSTLANGVAPLIAWTPWIGWAADRYTRGEGDRVSWGVVLAALFALQILPGEPTSILIAGVLALGIALARSPRPLLAAARLVLPVLGSILLAAVALIPGAILLGESARQAGVAGALDKWPMHPARIIEWIWPLAFGSERHDGFYAQLLLARMPGDMCWAESAFLGLPVFLLAAAAAADRTARRLLIGSVLFVVLALGPFTPVLHLLRAVFPPLRLCYYPEKWIYGAILVWSILAGIGFTRVWSGRPARRLAVAAVAGAAVLGLACAFFPLELPSLSSRLLAKARAWQVPVDLESGLDAAGRGVVVAFLGALAFAAALFLRRLDRAPRSSTGPGGVVPTGSARRLVAGASPWTVGLGVMALLGPLLFTHWEATPLARRSGIEEVPRLLQPLVRPANGDPAPLPRVFRADPLRAPGPGADGDEMARVIHETIETNVAARFGVNVVSGMEPAESARARRFWDQVFPRMETSAIAGLIGVDAVAIQDPGPLAAMWPTVAEIPGGWTLLRTSGVRPRAFVTPRWSSLSESRALDFLAAPGRERDLALVAITNPDPAMRSGDGPLSPCRVERRNPERITLHCDAPAAGYAVLLEEAAPGWKATVDGSPVPIVLADGLFRAVAVGAGPHRVEFTYRTPGLRLGAVVSCIAWLAGAVIVAVRWGKRRG